MTEKSDSDHEDMAGMGATLAWVGASVLAVSCCAFGITTMIAGSPIPHQQSEVDTAGGIRGEPIELVKCETIDLMVTEIIAEVGPAQWSDIQELLGLFGQAR